MMKKALFLSMLLAIAAAGQSPAAGTGRDPGSGPRLKIESTEHDLGLVKRSRAITHTFRFQNTGSADLEIIQVVPG
ncbi:MAG: DUF1573 domain-containing protein [Acidobacteria bacterium]|nr:DUF1573 domain-containing protein [Acidobacteriota bacterium]